MRAIINRILFSIVIISSCILCVEPYTIPEVNAKSNLLVVDGFINASENKAKVKLSTAVNLTNDITFNPVKNASVSIEEQSGDSYTLSETESGSYEVSFVVNPQKKYRTLISINGKSYKSDFVEVISSPEINNLTWKPEANGVGIYLTTQDPTNKTKFYLWTYEETWEYTAAFQSSFIYLDGGSYTYRVPEQDIYHCWKSSPSTTIVIGTTNQLNQNLISDALIAFLPLKSEKLFLQYSILVKQIGITSEGYDFWQQLKKNTESLGTLFDPQPSQVTGNIYDEAGKPVLGYFYASSISEKRVMIKLNDLPKDYRFIRDFGLCEEDTILIKDLPKFQPKTFNLVVGVYNTFGSLIGFRYSTHPCTDCILQGGTRQRPNYW